jgi:hypothetical protein
MLTTLTSLWKGLPEWVQGILGAVAAVTAYWIVKARYRREDRRRSIEAYLWLAALIAANWIWGVPGLLILLGFAGGFAAWHFALRADAAEVRRRRRLLEAMIRYLEAQYNRSLDLDPDTKVDFSDYQQWLKKKYSVAKTADLLDEWDDQGTTVEDLYRRMDAEQAATSARVAEKAKESASV